MIDIKKNWNWLKDETVGLRNSLGTFFVNFNGLYQSRERLIVQGKNWLFIYYLYSLYIKSIYNVIFSHENLVALFVYKKYL